MNETEVFPCQKRNLTLDAFFAKCQLACGRTGRLTGGRPLKVLGADLGERCNCNCRMVLLKACCIVLQIPKGVAFAQWQRPLN